MKVLLQGSADLAASKAQLADMVAVFTQLQDLCVEHFKEEEVRVPGANACVGRGGVGPRSLSGAGRKGLHSNALPPHPSTHTGSCHPRHAPGVHPQGGTRTHHHSNRQEGRSLGPGCVGGGYFLLKPCTVVLADPSCVLWAAVCVLRQR
jgi:hypothetical protein